MVKSGACGCNRKRYHGVAHVVAGGAEGGTVALVRSGLTGINVDGLMHAAPAVVATWINDALYQHQHAVITTVLRISGLASVRRLKFRRTSQRSRL